MHSVTTKKIHVLPRVALVQTCDIYFRMMYVFSRTLYKWISYPLVHHTYINLRPAGDTLATPHGTYHILSIQSALRSFRTCRETS